MVFSIPCIHYPEYKEPHDYFKEEDAQKIVAAQSLQANLYWARLHDGLTIKKNEDTDGTHQVEVKESQRNIRCSLLKEYRNWFMNLVAFIFLFFLGFFFGKTHDEIRTQISFIL